MTVLRRRQRVALLLVVARHLPMTALLLAARLMAVDVGAQYRRDPQRRAFVAAEQEAPRR
ncbi:MAG: hypothetical protein R2856_13745 [Caldilineaceae bacterium]